MTRSILIALGLPGALLLAPAALSQTSTAKPVALCVPPGGIGFAPCPATRAGQTIRLQVATTDLPIDAINLRFTENAPAGQAPRTATEIIPASRSRDGSYEVTVPAELCTTGRGTTGSFEVQHVLNEFNDTVVPKSLGTLTVAC